MNKKQNISGANLSKKVDRRGALPRPRSTTTLMNKKQDKDWEKELIYAEDGEHFYIDGRSVSQEEYVKEKERQDFIRQTLNQEKLELIERMSMEKKPDHNIDDNEEGTETNQNIGYNQAVSELNQKLDHIKKEMEGKGK